MTTQDTLNNNRRTWSQQAAFVLFCATSVQLAMLKTFVPVIPGLKVDVYSGLLCALTLSCATLTARPGSIRASWPELTASFSLLVLAALSGLYSSTKWSSLAWGLSWTANALGGFWSARILLDDDFRRKVFVWLCAATIYVLMMLGLWGFYFHGMSQYFVDDLHQLVNIILLMSFASITLISVRKTFQTLAGLAVLIASFGALYVCGIGGVEAAMLIPAAIIVPGVIIMLFSSRAKLAPIVIGVIFIAISAHYVLYVSGERFQRDEYQQERLEFYPLSLHIAEKSPWVGIGLRSPRDSYLDDYELRFTRQSDEQFASTLSTLVTSQNVFLTFMVGFGIPFALIYVLSLAYLLIKLLKAVLHPPQDPVIPPLALFISIVAAILHFMMMDILIQPQIAWFFHILLSLIPTVAPAPHRVMVPLRKLAIGTGGLVVVAIAFFLIVTHPVLRQKFPFLTKVAHSIKRLPLISILTSPRPYQKTDKAIPKGWIEVNLRGYEGKQSKWAVVVMLDNSPQMFADTTGWNPNRITASFHALNMLGAGLTEDSTVTARAFVEEGPFRRKGKDYNFRLSQVLFPWTPAPTNQVTTLQTTDLIPGSTNLCAAIESVMRRDFLPIDESLKPRLLIITDSVQDCPKKPIMDIIRSTDKSRQKPVIDYIFIGPEKDQPGILDPIATETGGFSAFATTPEALAQRLEEYIEILQARTFAPIILVNNRRKIELQPGSFNELPAGTYELIAPPAFDLDESERKIPEVVVVAGDSLTLEVEMTKEGVRAKKEDGRSEMEVGEDVKQPGDGRWEMGVGR